MEYIKYDKRQTDAEFKVYISNLNEISDIRHKTITELNRFRDLTDNKEVKDNISTIIYDILCKI